MIVENVFAFICAFGIYLPVNLWYPGRDEYYSFTELYKAFKQLYAQALGEHKCKIK